jgi:hypothetical protein
MRSNRLYETDSFLLHVPGSKLPGYYHSFRPGQSFHADYELAHDLATADPHDPLF